MGAWGVDWGFWVLYLLPTITGAAAGWYIRGQWEEARHEEIARGRWMHPSNKHEREWWMSEGEDGLG